MEAFLEKYISIWNGIDFVDEIFELLTYVRPLAFEGIQICPDRWYPDILTFYYRLGIQLSEATLSIVLCIGCDVEGK